MKSIHNLFQKNSSLEAIHLKKEVLQVGLFDLFNKVTRSGNLEKVPEDTSALQDRILELSEQLIAMSERQQQMSQQLLGYETSVSTYESQLNDMQQEIDVHKKEVLRKEQQIQQLVQPNKSSKPAPAPASTSDRMSDKYIALEKYYQGKLQEAELKIKQMESSTIYTSSNVGQPKNDTSKIQALLKQNEQLQAQNKDALEKVKSLEKQVTLEIEKKYETQLDEMYEKNKKLLLKNDELKEQLQQFTGQSEETAASSSLVNEVQEVPAIDPSVEKTENLKAFIEEMENKRTKIEQEIDPVEAVPIVPATALFEEDTSFSSEDLPDEIVSSLHHVVDTFYTDVEKKQLKQTSTKNHQFFDRDDPFEYQHLAKTVQEIKSQIPKDLPSRFKVAEYYEAGWHKYTPEQIHSEHAKIAPLKEQANRPYFGRMDLYNENTGITYYVGIKSMGNHIISWQTDAASIYYERNIGQDSHHPTLGMVKLDYLRQIDIDQSKIKRLHPPMENEASIDHSLQHTLASKRGQDMQNIVATIQKEQNELIRLPIHNPIIIQGSAGSGKSVIALHRLSYLLYKYKNLKENAVAIFGPNKLFLEHIRKVLPELGNYQIVQTTFQEYAFEQLNLKKEAFSRYKGDDQQAVVHLKGSLAYKDYVACYVDLVVNNVKPWIAPFTYQDKYVEIQLDALEIGLYYEGLDLSYQERRNSMVNWLTQQVNKKVKHLQEKEEQKESFIQRFSDTWLPEILSLPNPIEDEILFGEALLEEINTLKLELLSMKKEPKATSTPKRMDVKLQRRKQRVQSALQHIVAEQMKPFSSSIDTILDQQLEAWLQPILDLWWEDQLERELDKLNNRFLLSTIDMEQTIITSIRNEFHKPAIVAEQEQRRLLFQQQLLSKRSLLEEKVTVEMKDKLKNFMLHEAEKAWNDRVSSSWALQLELPINHPKPSWKEYNSQTKDIHQTIKAFVEPHFNMSATDLLSSILQDNLGIQQLVLTEIAEKVDAPILQQAYEKSRQRGKLSWLRYEDIPSLLHIERMLKGQSYMAPLSYLILDEAQDYMPYEIYTMSRLTSSNGLMLIGDLGQNLNCASDVVNWRAFNDLLDTPAYYELQATYRSTTQIVEVSSQIIRPFSEGKYNLSEQTYREGAEVQWRSTTKPLISKHINQLVKNIQKHVENYESIAIIAKTLEEAKELKQNLEIGLQVEIQTEEQPVQSKVIITTPIAAKGLEFDCVIITDLSQYDASDFDRKLAYVATSRALHELHIFHTDSIEHLVE